MPKNSEIVYITSIIEQSLIYYIFLRNIYIFVGNKSFMQDLNTEITYIKGVGPKRAEILAQELYVHTMEDMIFYFPYKYVDRSRFYQIKDIRTDAAYVQIRGKFCCFSEEGQARKKYLHGEFFDQTGSIDVVWFQRIKWVKENINPKKEYIVFGKPKEYRGKYSISHPEFELVEVFEKQTKSPFFAEYNTTEKMKKFYLNSKAISKIIREIFSKKIVLQEILPAKILRELHLPAINKAIFNIHFPQNMKELDAARKRFKFEELFVNQLSLIKQKKIRNFSIRGIKINKVGDLFNRFYSEKLEFELTDAQKRVIKEIYSDFKSGKQANRLLQGDVGSGKTIVALLNMLILVGNGYQATMMAPTEILARQHYEEIARLLNGLDVNMRILTGSTKVKERRIIDEELLSGDLDILIGTHALIEDKIKFKNLGIAIIDEQHRFGVVQRAKLRNKNENEPPHIIVMTATPIPRTLSMTLYGDLDLSVIDELPPGRKPIKTLHLRENQRGKLYSFIRKEIEKGRQIYIVFPLISESETLDLKNLEDGYEIITEMFKLPKYTVAMVHGKMKAVQKQEQMDLFASGKAQILVATTVIEVGVNVPNASVMIIESAERFGLSQLHQLRGRVGRGADQSFCILMSGNKLSSDSKKRLETMVRTNNGFEIAEVDMRLRGPGNIFGTQQSGVPLNFKIANLITDTKILQLARQKAMELIETDPQMQNTEYKFLAQKVNKEIRNSFGNVG